MKLKITIEVDLIGSYSSDDDELMWLENEILIGNRSLILHSNEVGDVLGEVTKVSGIKWIEL